jgi:hypothetical protein
LNLWHRYNELPFFEMNAVAQSLIAEVTGIIDFKNLCGRNFLDAWEKAIRLAEARMQDRKERP